jgi:signal transduction histidine kinase
MDLPGELPRVWADPRRIRQVLNNILENAIKYAPNGGQITVACEVENDFVIVSISDQGEGIPQDLLERVFDRFFQVDGAATRKTGGSGLGLAIAKGIIEAHGGSIWAESEPARGATFRFALPIAKESDLLQNQSLD